MFCVQRNSKNKCFLSNFDEKSMFFQTDISYSQNLRSQTNFISIDCKMFVDYGYNNRILLNMKYRRKRGMSCSSFVCFSSCPDRCPERCPDQRPCPCPDQLCTSSSQPMYWPLSLPLPRPNCAHPCPDRCPERCPDRPFYIVPAPAPTNCARSLICNGHCCM